ncbi:MAG: FAD-linked oxidase C-terminal domain-containing protein [Planctomycetota bacterium]
MHNDTQDHSSKTVAAIVRDLSGRIEGEVRADRLIRALYATDASIYQIVPDVVVFPRSSADVTSVVRACVEHGLPLTARGAGTGLTGAAVNRGVQLDCSRHLNRILAVDPRDRTVRVEPGVVLDELNAELRPHGLHFAPDVATSSRATLGGMIANNSCGARSILHGRTVDHVLSLDVVLSDGSRHVWGSPAAATGRGADNPLARLCEEKLAEVAGDHADEIAARFPKVSRRNGGYALDRLRVESGHVLNPETIVCGSEGTLCVVVGATLKLTPLPRHKGLLVAHFDDLSAALEATPAALAHQPAAVELIDKLVLDAARANPAMARRSGFIERDPRAVLIIEMYDDETRRLTDRLRSLAADLESRSMGYAWPIMTDDRAQADVWTVRKSGLGLLMSRPGDRQPYAFVEDTAVEPARLRGYVDRFRKILEEEQVEEAGYYAHASVGCLHIRPVLNLKRRDDVRRMRRIADRVSSLALEFGGTMTGEHGDGIVRSCWLEKMYGSRLVGAFSEIKRTFDPHGLFNPGKIVDPLPMTENLRYSPEPPRMDSDTLLDFDAHGGIAGLAGMCSGVGQCRQRLVGTMCPSYTATGRELDSTRGRANALRIALSGAGPLDGLDDDALDEVMELCLSCKACKTECPTGVDMARLKAEWLACRHRSRGIPVRNRLVAAAPGLAAWGCRFAPLSNWVLQSRPMRVLLEWLFGLDRRVPPPRYASRTFRQWFAARRHRSETSPASRDRPRVVYFVDTWTNYHTPQVGRAAVKVLEALGCEVVVPPTQCCGRPAISKGVLEQAKRLATANIAVLAQYAERGVPIVGTEPSCLLTLVDEYPQFVRTMQAHAVAAAAQTIESFVADILRQRPDALKFKADGVRLLYHGHCHQKAIVGTDAAIGLLDAFAGDRGSEIDSGCCGMAGSFGHEVEHYDVAKAVGEGRLFPAIRNRGDAEIAVSGFSCRQQIAHHTGVTSRHLIEYLADALDIPDESPHGGANRIRMPGNGNS